MHLSIHPAIVTDDTPACHDRDAGYPTLSVAHPSIGASPGVPDPFPNTSQKVRAAVTGLVDEGYRGGDHDAIPTALFLEQKRCALWAGEKDWRKKGGRVARLVYIAAMVLRKGETGAELGLRDEMDGAGVLTRGEGAIDNKDCTVSISNVPVRFYHDLPPEEAEQYQRMMLPQPAGMMISSLTYKAYRNIPPAYLLTEEDHAFSIKTQREIIEETGIDMVEGVKASHSPFLSNPGLVASFIRRAAGEKL